MTSVPGMSQLCCDPDVVNGQGSLQQMPAMVHAVNIQITAWHGEHLMFRTDLRNRIWFQFVLEDVYACPSSSGIHSPNFCLARLYGVLWE